MGYDYTLKEFKKMRNMYRRESELIEEYKKGKSFSGYYAVLVSDGKYPYWSVTKTQYWDSKENTIQIYGKFNSLKKAIQYCNYLDTVNNIIH